MVTFEIDSHIATSYCLSKNDINGPVCRFICLWQEGPAMTFDDVYP
jgi:hypothetical protein